MEQTGIGFDRSPDEGNDTATRFTGPARRGAASEGYLEVAAGVGRDGGDDARGPERGDDGDDDDTHDGDDEDDAGDDAARAARALSPSAAVCGAAVWSGAIARHAPTPRARPAVRRPWKVADDFATADAATTAIAVAARPSAAAVRASRGTNAIDHVVEVSDDVAQNDDCLSYLTTKM